MRYCLSILATVCAALAWGGESVSPWSDAYVSSSAAMRFFGGGAPARLASEVETALGYDFSEFWSAEAGASWAPWVEGDRASGGQIFGAYADALRHLDSYERFDPYLALGLGVSRAEENLYDDGGHPFAAGPRAGIGFFYNLSDRWAFRADARACMAVDETCAMEYTLSVGFVYRLGGTGLTAESWKQPQD